MQEGFAGFVAKFTRGACYWWVAKDTQNMGWREATEYHLANTATCERAGNFVFSSQYAQPIQIVTVATAAGLYFNALYRRAQYRKYKTKCSGDNPILTADERLAFNLGLSASNSKSRRLGYFFRPISWQNAPAYCAGFEACRESDQEMINVVTLKA